MATKIVVMSKGWVQQIGTPGEIYRNPKNIFVATFIGSPAMNIFDAEYDNGRLVFNNGYEILLPDETISRHNSYYEAKIKDLKRMLSTPDFKKMHALKLLDKHLFGGEKAFDVSSISDDLDEILGITADIECASEVKSAVELIRAESRTDRKALLKLREPLLTFEKIPSSDIGTLHNAQVFSKEEIVVDNTLYYHKPKKKKKNTKLNINLNSTDIEFVNNLFIC